MAYYLVDSKIGRVGHNEYTGEDYAYAVHLFDQMEVGQPEATITLTVIGQDGAVIIAQSEPGEG